MSPSLQLDTRISADEKLPSCSSKTLVAAPPVPSPISPQDYDPSINAKPYSPFYRHATLTTIPMDGQVGQPTTTKTAAVLDGPYELESATSCQKQSEESQKNRGSKLWEQRRRRCSYFHSLPKKQRLTIKVIVAIVTVGSMVAIALGITVAVGGGVWKSDHQQGAIGSR
ncbi:uncharacterized protein ACLA_048870 [Aspergillus clavatus NRRL 1]|uniref:Uncharacterized protein n=1 Tax=Aspergillus clavatus (strain ATCC 1007 / CBS 513.65 / DSM 816 / NCTC 3887 / NRRL 1 / QM 1276 / 107) TaxID=344612 RepID=A1CHR0_ASPCL|nr:uncharacterized protein ACLA_048870 [Aspergillus clavatus NRRL 1]EAW10415.1 conserved hypothetical protein [Aspergillus clavatus NRRL 1]